MPSAVSDFVSGAKTERKPKGEFPWEAHYIRKSVKKQMRIDLPEDLKLRLDFIAQNTPHSRVSFIVENMKQIIIDESDLLIAKGHTPIWKEEE